MPITSLEIKDKTFSTRFRGFDPEEVDEFLDIVRKNKEEEKREKEEIKNLKERRTLVENIENSEGEIIEWKS